MKDWLLQKALELLVGQITKDNIEKAANQVKNWFVPKVREWKADQIAKLEAEAKASGNQIDDALVAALDDFVDALLPDNPKTL